MQNYFDLGNYSRTISTASVHAQCWFDQGLNWLYGFNQEESVVCFKKAVEHDPKCAIAYWGIAYASGPFYNMPWEMFDVREEKEMLDYCYSQLQKAIELSAKASKPERALIKALTKRFQTNQPQACQTYKRWDDEYANAMRGVYQSYPQDLDVIALFAEAMMTRTPWKLWNLKSGKITDGADTKEIIEVLEQGLKLKPDGLPHPGISHMYIHALEMSPSPEKALNVADSMHNIQPDGGHLHHMPSHIYVLCGLYSDALSVSEKAIEADKKYLEYAGAFKFYTTAICHDLHLKMYAAMFCGKYNAAIEAADAITNIITDDVLKIKKPYVAMTLEGYYSMKMHVLVRFGRWQEIIDMPMPNDQQLYCVTSAMYRYAKGVAYAALGFIPQALDQQKEFEIACQAIPEERLFFNNNAHNILAIGREMMEGEIQYRKQNYKLAFASLTKAAELDDNLFYTEPWAWMHPPRHALGALLLEQGHVERASRVYRADLGLDGSLIRASQHPDNVWSLHGYGECLTRMGKHKQAKAIIQKLKIAQARTDIEINASCCCRKKVMSCCA